MDLSQLPSTAVRYAFAFNQSPLRKVLDPVYVTASKVLLSRDAPLSKELREATFEPNLFDGYRQRARKTQYFIEDWNFGEARPELLTPMQRRFVHTTTLGETSGMAVSDGFLRAFRTSPELASFFGVWFVEELNHYRGFHRYVEVMGERWPEDKVKAVAAVEFQPYSDDPMEICTANAFQELVAYLVYRSFGAQAKDPFLAKMVKQFAKDELRHFRFYEDVVARHLQTHPEFRSTVLKVFLKATTPYNQVSGGPKQVLEHIENGLFYFRAAEYAYFLDHVEYLLGERLEALFDLYFSQLCVECPACAKLTFKCACAEY
ncbi:MAG: acyl-ACP desaturase [Myxococcaceae bacterium]